MDLRLFGSKLHAEVHANLGMHAWTMTTLHIPTFFR